jgi:hypothetical protein
MGNCQIGERLKDYPLLIKGGNGQKPSRTGGQNMGKSSTKIVASHLTFDRLQAKILTRKNGWMTSPVKLNVPLRGFPGHWNFPHWDLPGAPARAARCLGTAIGWPSFHGKMMGISMFNGNFNGNIPTKYGLIISNNPYMVPILGSWSSHWNVQPCNFRGHLRRRCFLDASWWMSLDLQKIGPWSGILQWQQDEMVEDAKPSITRITQHFTGLPPTPQIPLGGNSVFTFHRGPIK